MIPASHFDRFATAKYQNKNPVQRRLIRRFAGVLDGLVRRAGPGTRVLEVGIGEGFLSGWLSERYPDTSFCGIDVCEQDIENLKEKFPHIDARVGSVYALDSHWERPFDLVLCCEVLEHLREPDKALEQIQKVAGQHAIFSVPHEPWFMLSNLARGKNPRRLGNDIDHHNHWGPQTFQTLLAPRFEIVSFEKSFPWLAALTRPKAP